MPGLLPAVHQPGSRKSQISAILWPLTWLARLPVRWDPSATGVFQNRLRGYDPAREGRFDLLTIRLARIGKKKQPSYRIVVIEKTRRRNGRFVEIVGHYDPLTKPAGIRLDADRIKHWLSCGAQPSDTVRSFIRKEKIA